MTRVIWFRGKAGVGKTFLSSQFAMRDKLPIFRKDDFFDTVFGYFEDNNVCHSVSYKLMHKLIDTNIECGTDIIVDCPLHCNDQLVNYRDKLNRKNIVFKPILVTCSNEELWAERFNQRKHSPNPNNIITDYEEMMKYYESRDINLMPVEGELVVDSSNDVEYIIEQINKYVMIS
ncbi:hypothetical protein B1A99_19510 [Cohnella sp. CIP 111063]|jgi:hypothetical protein|uniref:AAA family ATPase n=1 Tax=unclassified Cohnella TaxID=2636738 RepID=UPI000B8C1931|nr:MULTISPECIES: AAA family ATPase [unclassified Cohnella]OXS56520.1 hypothetical protein B1A99_19510 [Cohnella sp. CIP 111063]PRX68697.1 AAA domain-containing protein [Cohnella sp. SGD-V74]